MTSQSQICRSIIILASFLVLISQTRHVSAANCIETDDDLCKNISSSSQKDSENRVTLSLYYESMCPFCADFIVNHLVKIFQTDLINIVHLRLVPWGNTKILTNDTWVCQHGVDECQLDVTEACAINAWPGAETNFKFIYCVERLHVMGRHAEWRSCFGSTNLDSKPVDNCYNSGLGYQLENAYADETAKLNPRHRFVPWVVVNNYPLQEDFRNFISYICKAYKGSETPNACKSTSFKIDASKLVTSTP